MRICFLFNHDQIHQISHSLPIALSLARTRPDVTVIFATTRALLETEILRLVDEPLPANIVWQSLRLKRWSSRLAAHATEWLAPATKLLVYRDNLSFFSSLDYLVTAEKTSLILKTRYGLPLRIIHTRHGAGDRAIGFEASSALFDHILVSGPKIRDRLIDEAGVEPTRISIVGYPKFDLHAPDMATPAVSPDERPLVLYNPHPSPHLSSWYRLGPQVLDWFSNQDEYRLVFAPHIMLFQRRFVASLDCFRIDRPGRLQRRWRNAPNIEIDVGSVASTTMAHTNRADIYLGDVSSQVYEFLLRPRPCVFLDAHATAWAGDRNYAHWSAGPVISSIAELGSALAQARTRHQAEYQPVQQALFAASFDLRDEPSSERAASVLSRLVDDTRDRLSASLAQAICRSR